MFQTKTDDVIINCIISHFSEKKIGRIRVLISTAEFGMGVNCKGLITVIHFGPPPVLDDYF